MTVIQITNQLIAELNELEFSLPVTHVYNPLDYARKSHECYLKKYGEGKREILLLGMNPGPWGMAQNGIPFGDIVMVRDWIGVSERVDKPPVEHPKRPILGFENARREVSGKRLWGWAKERFETAERFFQRFFVFNYCPLAFFNEAGQNLTPDKLPVRDREPLLQVCDGAVRRYVDCFRPKRVIGIGGFAEQSARRALNGVDVCIGRIPHPSPASPLANRGWSEAADKAFADMGISL